MPYYVCKGAKLKCSMGSEQSDLEVVHLERPVRVCGQFKASVMDHKPLMNIKPFGQCKSLANPAVAAATAANNGRPQKMPCVPNTPLPWVNGKMNVFVKGNPALLDCSKCSCAWLGVIEITDPGQKLMSCGSSGLASQEMGASPAGAQNVAATPGNGLALQGAGMDLASMQQAVDGSTQAVSNNVEASQNAETATAAEVQSISVTKVTGPEKAFSRQKRKYEVAEYNVDKKKVNNENKANIKWAVKVAGERMIELAEKKGKEKVDIEIFDAWAGKDILVMAYIGDIKENVNQKTNIGPLSQCLLVRIVEGEDYALYGRKIEYEVTDYNKDNVNAGDKNRIKWAIKIEGENQEILKNINGGEITGEKITVEINRERINEGITRITVIPYLKEPAETRGKEIVFEIREGHIGEKSAEIIVMPYLNTPTEIVSKKTFMGENAFENLRSKINLLNGMDLSSDTSNDLSIKRGILEGGTPNERRCLYQELTDNERGLLIEELMDVMRAHDPNVRWVESAKKNLETETLKIRLVNSEASRTNANQNTSIAPAFLSPATPGNNEFAIIFNVNIVRGRRVGELQALFIHELRHFCQATTNKEPTENIFKTSDRKTWRGKFYDKDIDIEIDAFNIQFRLERVLRIDFDDRGVYTGNDNLRRAFTRAKGTAEEIRGVKINALRQYRGYNRAGYTNIPDMPN